MPAVFAASLRKAMQDGLTHESEAQSKPKTTRSMPTLRQNFAADWRPFATWSRRCSARDSKVWCCATAGGAGVWSFLHIDDAAQATAAAIERGQPGLYNVVDDDPAPVSDWLPALAAAIGAKAPWRVPTFIGRLAVGEHGVMFMTESRGASNAKAKRVLGWAPIWPNWREGFRRGLSTQSSSSV